MGITRRGIGSCFGEDTKLSDLTLGLCFEERP